MSLARDLADGVINGLTPQASNMQPFNRIINGAMTIDQRNAGAAVTITTNGTYSLDRWQMGSQTSSAFSVQQSSTAPTGFSNSMLVTSLAATTISSGSYYTVLQVIEGFNFSDMGFGTANAKSITISFWVRGSLTGTFGGWIQNANVDRSYPFSYTISTANTWEQKTVTIAGDTSGTWVGATNGNGVYVGLSLGIGSDRQGTANTWQAGNKRSVTGETSLVATSGATFYITGVQLEAGSAASSFAYENVGDTLQKCQRYYQVYGNGVDNNFAYLQYSSTYRQINFTHSPLLRAAPTITQNYLAQYSAGIVYRNEFNICGLYLSMNYDNSAANYASKLTFDAEL